MKALPVVLALVVVLAGGLIPVWANPGDAVAVRGTLAWPAILANEPFVVVRADNGRFYYADVSAAQRRGTDPLRAGNRIALVGTEGTRPHELTATALGLDESAVSAVPPTVTPTPSTPVPPATSPAPSVPGEAASPRTDLVAPPPPPTTERTWERVRGTVQSVSGHTLVIRRDDGQQVNIDVSRLDGTLAREVRPGEVVTVFGRTEAGKAFSAVGFVRTEPAKSAPPSR